MRWKSLFDVKDIVLMFLGFCCVNMVLFTLIPVTVERSVSVFTLSYMMENPGVYTVSDMEDIFHKTYVCEFQAFDKRFEEQIISGNVEEKDGGYVLTKRGEFTVNFFRTISSLFNTDERLIYPNENTEQGGDGTAWVMQGHNPGCFLLEISLPFHPRHGPKIYPW